MMSSTLWSFLVEKRLVRDPALPLRMPKKRESLPDVLAMGEFERLLAAPARDELWERHFPGKPERDRLLLALMAYGGLRRSELLGHKHLDSTQRYTRVNAHELRGAIKRLRWVGERPAPSAPSEA